MATITRAPDRFGPSISPVNGYPPLLNPENVLVDDDSFAVSRRNPDSGNRYGANAFYFTFSGIPDAATITNVTIRARGAGTVSGNIWFYIHRGTTQLDTFPIGTPTPKTTAVYSVPGGWTPANINSLCVQINPSSGSASDFLIYYLEAEVTYLPPFQTINLDANLSAASSLIADLTRAVPTEASLQALSSLSATLQAQVALTASLIASGALSADLQRLAVIAIDAALKGNGELLGQVLRALDQDGALLTNATLNGSLDRLVPLASLLTSNANLTAILDKAINLEAALLQDAKLTASLFRVLPKIRNPSFTVVNNSSSLLIKPSDAALRVS